MITTYLYGSSAAALMAGGGGPPPGGDPFWTSVVLLIPGNGTDGSTTVPDVSNTPHVVSAVSNAQIDTAQFKWGGSSVSFDKLASQLSIPDSADWILAPTDSDHYTIDVWVRMPVISGFQHVLGQRAGGNWWSITILSSGHMEFVYFDAASVGVGINTTASGVPLVTNTWYLLSVDKGASGKIRLYVNGVMRGSASPPSTDFFNFALPLLIGAAASGANPFGGWMNDIRITKGVARYDSDAGFTVPTAAFPTS